MSTSLHDVCALIDEAFAGIQRDENCTIHQAQLADERLDREIPDKEWVVQKRRDPETNWRDVPASSLDECDAVLSHATPQSWLFYLPTYMKRALELLTANSEKSNLPNSVLFHLSLERGSRGPSFYVFERFKQVTPAQERAIIAFLEYVQGYSNDDRWHAHDGTHEGCEHRLTITGSHQHRRRRNSLQVGLRSLSRK
jgi:hypothetical protein